MLSGHRIPSPLCVDVVWEIQFHLCARMLLSEDGEQVEATIHFVAQVTSLRQQDKPLRTMLFQVFSFPILFSLK